MFVPREGGRGLTKFGISGGHKEAGLAQARACGGVEVPHVALATNTQLRPDKPSGATSKSSIVLEPWLTLSQLVPGSSPGAPTI